MVFLLLKMKGEWGKIITIKNQLKRGPVRIEGFGDFLPKESIEKAL